ncbi:MAG: response regulator [Candidatus Peregrinibacteria bacterium]|nr:response regulator [Candidatus Peregrinibacteria bacterium]MCB9808282.1 response regulator [Candidatus Peribacteria bacterium]
MEKHILVVDDNLTQLRILADQLVGIGATVSTATDGSEVTRMLTNTTSITALRLDTDMPMNGPETLLALLAQRKEVLEQLEKICLCSHHVQDNMLAVRVQLAQSGIVIDVTSKGDELPYWNTYLNTKQ